MEYYVYIVFPSDVALRPAVSKSRQVSRGGGVFPYRQPNLQQTDRCSVLGACSHRRDAGAALCFWADFVISINRTAGE